MLTLNVLNDNEWDIPVLNLENWLISISIVITLKSELRISDNENNEGKYQNVKLFKIE